MRLPSKEKTAREEFLEWFWSKVNKKENCWVWEGKRSSQSYGTIAFYNWRVEMAHRVSYCIANNLELEDINDLLVCHKCDNPPCIRPSHLFLGTAQDNSDDKVSKGRQSRGVDRPKAKLNKDKVLNIRKRVHEGDFKTLTQLANGYNVSDSVIRKVVKGKTWKHIGGPLTTKDFRPQNSPHRGEENHLSKLTRKEVEKMRFIYKNNTKLTYNDLADKFNISKNQVGRIIREDNWK